MPGREEFHLFPAPETVFLLHNLHIFRFQDIRQINGLTPAVRSNQFLTADNIIFLKLFLKPLVNLVFRLSALDNIQPVPARSLGILGRQYLDPVSVLDLIINVDQFPVHTGSHHLIAHRAVNRIGKIHRRRTVWQVFHIPIGGKAVYVLREQIQIAF